MSERNPAERELDTEVLPVTEPMPSSDEDTVAMPAAAASDGDTATLPVAPTLAIPVPEEAAVADDTRVMPATPPQPDATQAMSTAASRREPVAAGASSGGDDTAPTATVPLYSTTPPRHDGTTATPNYVQVPVAPAPERPVIRKTGPSAATIVFGVLLMLTGFATVLLGIGFPAVALPGLGGDPRVALAVLCGAFGAILVIVAMVWAVIRIIRPKHEDGGASNPAQ